MFIVWKMLNLASVKDITTLHIVCGVDIACFLVSWILDIVCQKLSDYGGVYHSARRDVVVIVKHRFCCLLDKIANEDEYAPNDNFKTHVFIQFLFVLLVLVLVFFAVYYII